jgi:protein-disulfide isomerase
MTNLNRELASMTKKERKEFQREIARIEREQERKRRTRRRIVTILVTVVAVLAVLALVGWAVFSSLQNANRGPKNMLSDGIVLTGDGQAITATQTKPLEWGAKPVATTEGAAENQVSMRLYVDYSDKDAATFSTSNLEQLQQWLTAGYVTLEVHPVSISGDGYGLRAANAAACVADLAPDTFLAAHTALAAAQAEATASSPSNEEIATAMSGAGITAEGVSACITDGKFDGWVTRATERATASTLPGSDTALKSGALLLVNGQPYTGALDDPAEVIAFITQVLEPAVQEEGADGGTETPAPSGTPTPTPTP